MAYQITDDNVRFPGYLSAAKLAIDGAASIGGALALTGAITATGGLLANGSVVVSTGTAPTLPAAIVAFFGSQNNQAIVFPSAIGCMGRMLYVTTAGTGTLTATGYGTQLIGDNGTQAYTPGKHGLYISSGAQWLTMIESV